MAINLFFLAQLGLAAAISSECPGSSAECMANPSEEPSAGDPVAQCSSDITTDDIAADVAPGAHESVDQFDGTLWMQTRLQTIQTTHESNNQSLRKAEEPSQQKVNLEEKIVKTLDGLQQEVKQIEQVMLEMKLGEREKTNPATQESVNQLRAEVRHIGEDVDSMSRTQALNQNDLRGRVNQVNSNIQHDGANTRRAVTDVGLSVGRVDDKVDRLDTNLDTIGIDVAHTRMASADISNAVSSNTNTLDKVSRDMETSRKDTQAMATKLDHIAYSGHGKSEWQFEQTTAFTAPTAAFVTSMVWKGWSSDRGKSYNLESFTAQASSCWNDGDASACHTMMATSEAAMNDCWEANAYNAQKRAQEQQKNAMFAGVAGVVGGLGSVGAMMSPVNSALMTTSYTVAGAGLTAGGVAAGMSAATAGKYPDLSEKCLQQGQYAMIANQKALITGQETLVEGQSQIMEQLRQGFRHMENLVTDAFSRTAAIVREVADDIGHLKDLQFQVWNALRAGQSSIMAGLASVNMKLDKVLKKLEGVETKLDTQEFARLDLQLHHHASEIAGAATTLRDLYEESAHRAESTKTLVEAADAVTAEQQEEIILAIAGYLEAEQSTWAPEKFASLIFTVRDALSKIEAVIVNSGFLSMHFTLMSESIVSCANVRRESLTQADPLSIPDVSYAACADANSTACKVRTECGMPDDSHDVCHALVNVLHESYILEEKPISICSKAFTPTAIKCTQSILQYLIDEQGAGSLAAFLEEIWLEAFFVASQSIPKSSWGQPDYLSRAGSLTTMFRSYHSIGLELKRLKDKFATEDVAQTMIETIWDTLLPLLCPAPAGCIAASVANFEEMHTAELFSYNITGFSAISSTSQCTDTGNVAITMTGDCAMAASVMGLGSERFISEDVSVGNAGGGCQFYAGQVYLDYGLSQNSSVQTLCADNEGGAALITRSASEILNWQGREISASGVSYACNERGVSGLDLVELNLWSTFGKECSKTGAGDFQQVITLEEIQNAACHAGGVARGFVCGDQLCRTVACHTEVHGFANMNNYLQANTAPADCTATRQQEFFSWPNSDQVTYYPSAPNCDSVLEQWWLEYLTSRKCGTSDEEILDVNHFCSQQRAFGAQFLSTYKLVAYSNDRTLEDAERWSAEISTTCWVPFGSSNIDCGGCGYGYDMSGYEQRTACQYGDRHHVQLACLCPAGGDVSEHLVTTYTWAHHVAKDLATKLVELASMGTSGVTEEATYDWLVRSASSEEDIPLGWHCSAGAGSARPNFRQGYTQCSPTTEFSAYEDKFPVNIYKIPVRDVCAGVYAGQGGYDYICGTHPRTTSTRGGYTASHDYAEEMFTGYFTTTPFRTKRTDNYQANNIIELESSHTIQVQCDYTEAKQMEQVDVTRDDMPTHARLRISPLVVKNSTFDLQADAMASSSWPRFFQDYCAVLHADLDDCDNCTKAVYNSDMQICEIPPPCEYKCSNSTNVTTSRTTVCQPSIAAEGMYCRDLNLVKFSLSLQACKEQVLLQCPDCLFFGYRAANGACHVGRSSTNPRCDYWSLDPEPGAPRSLALQWVYQGAGAGNIYSTSICA